jgi:predicted DNA-binding transcriptional regulator AlpA
MKQQSPSLALLREMFPDQVNIELQCAARALGVAQQTAYNQVSAGNFPVRTFKLGAKRVCNILDLAAVLEAQRDIPISVTTPNKPRRPGRPTNAERMARQSASQ